MTWLADVNNITSNEALGNRTPFEKRHGDTPDISAYILFTFWEKILYLDPEVTFPESKEEPGHFLGVAKTSGDALTFIILTSEHQVLVRSVIRPASGKPLAGYPNNRVTHVLDNVTEPLQPPYPDHEPPAMHHMVGGGVMTWKGMRKQDLKGSKKMK